MLPVVVALHVVICTQFNGLPLNCVDRLIATSNDNPHLSFTYCTMRGWEMVAKYKMEELPDGWKVYKVRCTLTNKPREIPA